MMGAVIEAMTRSLPPGAGVWDEETLARIGWACIARPGDNQVGTLIEAVGAVEALEVVVATRDGECAGIRLRPIRVELLHPFAATILRQALTAAPDVRVVTPDRPGWPAQLDDLGETAPYALWVKGDLTTLARPSVAVTGSCNPTPAVVHEALDIASALADRGYVIVTGAGAGVEELALRAADVVHEPAVAVIPSGIGHYVSREQDALLGKIAIRGAVVSELPPPTRPSRWLSEPRSRLVAALAPKLVAVDAGSGVREFPVVRAAEALGRPVGVVQTPNTTHRSVPEGMTRMVAVREVAWL